MQCIITLHFLLYLKPHNQYTFRTIIMEIQNILQNLKINKLTAAITTGTAWHEGKGTTKISSYTPINGELLGTVSTADRTQYDAVIEKAKEAAIYRRNIPAPKRGEIVRQIGESLR